MKSTSICILIHTLTPHTLHTHPHTHLPPPKTHPLFMHFLCANHKPHRVLIATPSTSQTGHTHTHTLPHLCNPTHTSVMRQSPRLSAVNGLHMGQQLVTFRELTDVGMATLPLTHPLVVMHTVCNVVFFNMEVQLPVVPTPVVAGAPLTHNVISRLWLVVGAVCATWFYWV